MTPRAAAAAALARVFGGRCTLDEALDEALGALSGRDRALAREIAFGVCRRYHELDALLGQLLAKPLKARDRDLHALLLAGIYQLRWLRVPDHAAVSETVAATRQLGKPWARGLVNAVLRAYQSRATELTVPDEAARLSHPRWLFEALRAAWPQQWQAIVAANNEAPEMSLRVNTTRIGRADWIARAAAQGITASACAWADAGVILAHPVDVAQLPGFAEGWVSVQNQGAQLAAALLDCQPRDRVLDACAAPGGKACHLLEREPDIELLALDADARRQQRTAANLERLGLRARIVSADATAPAAWWDGNPFERILIDAPCSATGVIRRHPDIKLLRSARQVASAVTLQHGLLAALWPCLARNGALLYCTCSVLPQENEQLLAAFLAATPDACELPLRAGWGIERRHGRQLLPLAGAHDGFFYALLRKTGSGR